MASSMGRPTYSLKWFERFNQPKKLPLVQQAYVLSVLADLLGQGFALSTALQFLALLMPKYQALLLKVDAALVEGQSLEKSLAQLGQDPGSTLLCQSPESPAGGLSSSSSAPASGPALP